MSGYDRVFSGPLCGRWPAAPLYVTLLSLADRDGRVECIHHAIAAITGWPEHLLRLGIAELEHEGLIVRLFDHLDWGWIVADYRVSGTARLSPQAWAAIRAEVFERDDYTCAYCGQRGGKLECDHVIPIARGGTNELGNLITACATCNKAKRDKLLSEWRR